MSDWQDEPGTWGFDVALAFIVSMIISAAFTTFMMWILSL